MAIISKLTVSNNLVEAVQDADGDMRVIGIYGIDCGRAGAYRTLSESVQCAPGS